MNGILIIDKPSGITSHDVVEEIRKITGLEKVGHTGTLDPLATGVLVLCLGKATRLTQFLQQGIKEYLVRVRLGLVTDSQDITGHPLSERDCRVKQSEVEKALSQFEGKTKQVPPIVSAIKIKGKPLYKLARRGREASRLPREVEIYNLELLEFNSKPQPNFLLKATCSKGAYMRTLAHNLGEKLGCGGCLLELKRTRCGDFTLKDARSLSEIETLERGRALEQALIPLSEILPSWPVLKVKEKYQPRIAHGVLLTSEMIDPPSSPLKKEQYFKVVDAQGKLLAIAKATRDVDGKRENKSIAKWICVLI